MRLSRIIGATAVLLVTASWVLVPLPDICDEPGSLVLCSTRASAAGLTFARTSPWPFVAAVAVLLAIAVAGGACAARALRKQRGGAAE